MKDIKISLDHIRYNAKPNDWEAKAIAKRIGGKAKSIQKKYIKSYAIAIGEYGQTFCPATFFNQRKNKDNFEQMQLFALDFDGNIAIEDVRDRIEKYDLPVLFMYETFTSVNKNKFRCVFLNDVAITDIRMAEIIINALMAIFPEADKHGKDIAHMYYGGKRLLYYDDTIPTINIDSLIRNMTLYLRDKHGVTNYKRELITFSKSNNIALTQNKLLDIFIRENETEQFGASFFYKNSPKSITVNKTIGEKLSNLQYIIHLNNNNTKDSVENYDKKKILKNHAAYRSSVLQDISHGCLLCKEFETGSRRLGHAELFGIGNTMIQIESGIKRFIEILEKHSYYDDRSWKYGKWKKDLEYNKAHGYHPQSCNSFCPHKDSCSHGATILSTVKPKCGTMEKIAGYEEKLYPLDVVVKELKQNILSALRADDTRVHVIKAPTATGKSEISLEIMKESGVRMLYAAPTNILKDDIGRRAEEKGIEVFKTPSLHDAEIRENIPEEIRAHIDYLYHSGQYRLVNSYIGKVASEQDIDCLKEYMEELEKFHQFDGHIITTHRRLLSMSKEMLSKFDVIIIDEDIILKTIIPDQVQITVKELKRLAKTAWKEVLAGRVSRSAYKQLYKKLREVLRCIKTETLFTVKGFVWDAAEDREEDNTKGHKKPVDGTSTPIDMPSFCMAEHFYFRKASEERNLAEDSLVFLKPAKLQAGFKYIMLSATASEPVCSHYFGEHNIQFYECKKAEYAGTLNQFYDKSMSRSCIYNNPGIIDRIKERTGFEHTIIFKIFAKEQALYFGNNEGVDFLKGQNIDVIGTPYHAGFLYKLFPYTLGLHFDKEAKPIPNLPVTHNGYRFRFTTYKDKVLQEIQFWMLESDLEQAVGRARLLRYDCTVNLFSNFPLSQAVMKEYGYKCH